MTSRWRWYPKTLHANNKGKLDFHSFGRDCVDARDPGAVMSDESHNELVLLPSVSAFRLPSGELQLPLKYLRGAEQYAAHWPGPVTSLVRLSARPLEDADAIPIDQTTWRARVDIRPQGLKALTARLCDAALVFAGLEGREIETARLCHRAGIPLVFNSEYTLQTELQIISAEAIHILGRSRRRIWTWRNHWRRMRALRLASGLQCSGTPTLSAYQHLFPDALLFFDNRVPADSVTSNGELQEKLERIRRGAPLQLVFGGRLTAMKGVMDLPLVVKQLNQRGVQCNLSIVGRGELASQLTERIKQLGLDGQIQMLDSMDFDAGWLPLLKRKADLFVCCHPQGDPSSTYTEVMSCGVPIVGYANEAWSGIRALSEAGWEVPVGSPSAMASVIEGLDRDRNAIVRAAVQSVRFASAHTFERTFKARVDHLIRFGRPI